VALSGSNLFTALIVGAVSFAADQASKLYATNVMGIALYEMLIVGGAIGNAYDRLTLGAVTDFLNVTCCGINNPFAFNIADVAIFAGVALLLLRTHGDDARAEQE